MVPNVLSNMIFLGDLFFHYSMYNMFPTCSAYGYLSWQDYYCNICLTIADSTLEAYRVQEIKVA